MSNPENEGFSAKFTTNHEVALFWAGFNAGLLVDDSNTEMMMDQVQDLLKDSLRKLFVLGELTINVTTTNLNDGTADMKIEIKGGAPNEPTKNLN